MLACRRYAMPDPGSRGGTRPRQMTRERTVRIRFFVFSSRRRHTRLVSDWSSDVCSSDLLLDSFPRLVLILLVIAAFKADIYYVMVVVGITGMPVIANLIAGKIAFLRQKSFIEAAHALGLPAHTVILKHILWLNCRALLVIQATLGMGEAILVESSFSYLGLGLQEPTPSWGNMVQAGANYFLQGNFWPSTAPALAILATILGFQLLGDGLNNLLEGKRGK